MSSTESNAELWERYYTISEALIALKATHGHNVSDSAIYYAAKQGCIATVKDRHGMTLFLKKDVDSHRVSMSLHIKTMNAAWQQRKQRDDVRKAMKRAMWLAGAR